MTDKITRVEVAPTNLLKVLAAVHVHAAKGDTLPILNAVHIFHTDGQIVAEATDRYRLGKAVAEATLRSSGAGTEVLIPLATVKNLIRDLKPMAREPGSEITLAWSHDPMTSFTSVTIERFDVTRFATSFEMSAEVSQYPTLSKLFGDAFDVEPGDPGVSMALNPEYLNSFWAGIKAGQTARSRSALGNPPLRFHARDPQKPISVAYSDYFIGLIMPVRIDGGESDRGVALRSIADAVPCGEAEPAEVAKVA